MDIAHHGLEALTKLQNQSIHTQTPTTMPTPNTESTETVQSASDASDTQTPSSGDVGDAGLIIDYYDLCLVDFLMPVMSGVECLTQVD